MNTTSVINVPRRRGTVLHGLRYVITCILTGCCLFFLTAAARPSFTEVPGEAPLRLTHRLMATVIARDGITADSLSTAVTVLGPERGEALVGSVPGARVFIRRSAEDEGL